MIPASPEAIADANWSDLAPVYDELEHEPLDRAGVEGWLARWSKFDEVLTEAISTAMIAYTCDTGDAAKEAAHRRFSIDIAPRADERGVALARRFATLGYERPGIE